MPQNAHKLGKEPPGCVDAHIHIGTHPCRNKGLVKLITYGTEYYPNESEKRPSTIP